MPRQRHGKVSVYSASDRNDIIRHVYADEARRMLGTGEGVMLCRGCGRHKDSARRFCGAHAKEHEFVLTITPLYDESRRSHPSNASITFREMQANVGAVREGENGAIRAANEKIQAWPFEHDHRAVVVIPREAFA